ncbi:MAG: hypothetical protein JW932_00115 [Deltaproteobacteria bacterium]|nr:hypothetical protein [Deltaproteobacteria bacterium]
MLKKDSERRKNFRFRPDPLDYALIDKEAQKDSFDPKHIGLIINESYGGCDLAVLLECGIEKGDQLKIKLGESGVMKAEVSWKKTLDYKVSRIGLQYV